MTNWVNRNLGEICLAGFAVLTAAAIGISYQLGQNSTAVSQVSKDIDDLELKFGAGIEDIEARFDQLEIDLTPDDLKKILVATGTVGSADVFWAAVVDDAVWVFPSEDLHAKFASRGMQPEQVTWCLSGYKVLPGSATRP